MEGGREGERGEGREGAFNQFNGSFSMSTIWVNIMSFNLRNMWWLK